MKRVLAQPATWLRFARMVQQRSFPTILLDAIDDHRVQKYIIVLGKLIINVVFYTYHLSHTEEYIIN